VKKGTHRLKILCTSKARRGPTLGEEKTVAKKRKRKVKGVAQMMTAGRKRVKQKTMKIVG